MSHEYLDGLPKRMTSWPTPCPCSKHKGSAFVSLELLSAGKWLCPDSGETIVVNESVVARAARKHAEAVRRPRARRWGGGRSDGH